MKLGDIERATKLYADAAHDTQQQLGAKNPQTLTAKRGLSRIYLLQGEIAEAAKLLSQVLPIQREQFGDGHTVTLATKNNLAIAKNALGEKDEAEQLYLAVLDGRREQDDQNPVALNQTLSQVAFFYVNNANFAKAVPLYRELVARNDASGAAQDHQNLVTRTLLGQCLYKSGEHKAARLELEDLHEQCELLYPRDWLRPIVRRTARRSLANAGRSRSGPVGTHAQL